MPPPLCNVTTITQLAARPVLQTALAVCRQPSQATTRTYSFLFDDEAKAAADKIGDYINKNGKTVNR